MVEGTEGSHHKGGSTKMAKRTTICAGIDTGKRKLDIALDGSSEQLQVDNTPEGYKALLGWLRRHRVKRIGIEASGGYEQAVVAELRRQRFVVVVFQPAQVRAYAKFHLLRAKNDKIDAAAPRASSAPPASTASRPASVTIAIRPSMGRDGGGYRSDLGQAGTEIFLQTGLDRANQIDPPQQFCGLLISPQGG